MARNWCPRIWHEKRVSHCNSYQSWILARTLKYFAFLLHPLLMYLVLNEAQDLDEMNELHGRTLLVDYDFLLLRIILAVVLSSLLTIAFHYPYINSIILPIIVIIISNNLLERLWCVVGWSSYLFHFLSVITSIAFIIFPIGDLYRVCIGLKRTLINIVQVMLRTYIYLHLFSINLSEVDSYSSQLCYYNPLLVIQKRLRLSCQT